MKPQLKNAVDFAKQTNTVVPKRDLRIGNFKKVLKRNHFHQILGVRQRNVVALPV